MTNERYGPEGDPTTAKIIILYDIPTSSELATNKPLFGAAGDLLNESLRRVGLKRSDCFVLSIYNRSVKKDKKGNVYERHGAGFELWSERYGFTVEGQADEDRLKAALESCTAANIIFALGGNALAAVAGKEKSSISKYRGSIYQSKISKHKVVGTHHPASVFHGNFEWRYLIDYDMRRVLRESMFAAIKDLGHKFQMVLPFQEAMDKLRWIKETQKVVAWDIEVTGRQCAMIGFAWTRVDCLCINLPVYTAEQEMHIWVAMAEIIEDPEIENILQNGMFDVSFLAMHCAVRTRGKIHDTMLKHNLMYHEFPAGLAFMQSLYTDIPYHKDMVKHGDIEKAGG